MAGYIMTIGSEEYINMFYALTSNGKPRKRPPNKASSKKEGERMAKEYALEHCFVTGTYSARTSGKGPAFIGTLADYLGMKAGDDVFFFTDRKIYGIGILTNVADIDCRFKIQAKSSTIEDLTDEKGADRHFFTCTFSPAPYFFKTGVDMDEVLTFSPDKIKSLRFFSSRTFMKLDDFESEAIKNVIARKNEKFLNDDAIEAHYAFSEKNHERIKEKLLANREAYSLSIFDYIMEEYLSRKNMPSEYYIEGAIMALLRNSESKYIGKWDFIGRQYPASPPKPSEYEETMDLFGYRYVPGFDKAISKYVIIELKTGNVTSEHIAQTMKYVDWVSREYTKGDYSMIVAYTMGNEERDVTDEEISNIIERNYIVEGHPIKNEKWRNLRILSYYKLLDELFEKDENRK